MSNYSEVVNAELKKLNAAKKAMDRAEKTFVEKEAAHEAALESFQTVVQNLKDGVPFEEADEDVAAASE